MTVDPNRYYRLDNDELNVVVVVVNNQGGNSYQVCMIVHIARSGYLEVGDLIMASDANLIPADDYEPPTESFDPRLV